MHDRFWSARLPSAAAPIGAAMFLTLAIASFASASPLPHGARHGGGRPAIASATPSVTIEYKGTITESFESPPPASSLSSDNRKAELSWDETVTGPVEEIEAGKAHWHLNSLTGAVTDRQTESDGKPLGCEGRLSATSSDGGERGLSGPEASGGYLVRPPYGLPAQLVSSTGPTSGADTLCDTEHWNSTTGDTAWEDAVDFAAGEPGVAAAWTDTVRPVVEFPAGGGHTQSFPFHSVCAPPSCGTGSEYKDGVTTKFGSATVTVASSITFSAPGLSSGSPKPGRSTPGASREGKPPGPVTCPGGSKPTCPEKKLAQEDLKALLPNLANQCAISALGTGLLVAGLAAPESGVAVVLAAAGPTGAEVFALSAPACAILIKRAYDDAKIIEDPPIGALDTLAWPERAATAAAPLAPCTPYAGAIGGYCETLRHDAQRYLAALGSGEAVAGALVLTVDRITGAAKTHDRSALRRQSAHASLLRRRLRTPAARQRAAGRAIAALVGSEGLTMKLTAAQRQGGVTRALSGLRRRGISASRLTHLTGTELTAAPSDVLAGL
jgi:hypothetical protein